MELDELRTRLVPFVRDRYGDSNARVDGVHKMPGHAGFAYGFTAHAAGGEESWFLRLPPPNVNWRGTADVLRQVTVLNALDATDVPHCSVRWSGGGGKELEWFGPLMARHCGRSAPRSCVRSLASIVCPGRRLATWAIPCPSRMT